ncbi:hypothetical protein MtrunA17_Chr2g0278141 [Medicago truncatula]|uniref:Uncharacterized protein n=1 Tax=Medicago truncatula TaxID=3880 RepID=A0A396J0L0_MEDTR|nr:hypothetical protein MtrunA17_Chr2g0278141 [Medicago truncatula]
MVYRIAFAALVCKITFAESLCIGTLQHRALLMFFPAEARCE